jgi:hypothetical protein
LTPLKSLNKFVLVLAVFSVGATVKSCKDIDVVYAQSLPATVHVTWTPSVVDSTHSAPIQYSVVTDGGTAVVLQASSCTSTLCTVAISVNSFGQHSTVVSAQNYKIDSDPSTIQSSPAAPRVWVLNQGPNPATGTAIKD